MTINRAQSWRGVIVHGWDSNWVVFNSTPPCNITLLAVIKLIIIKNFLIPVYVSERARTLLYSIETRHLVQHRVVYCPPACDREILYQ